MLHLTSSKLSELHIHTSPPFIVFILLFKRTLVDALPPRSFSPLSLCVSLSCYVSTNSYNLFVVPSMFIFLEIIQDCKNVLSFTTKVLRAFTADC